MSSLLVKISVEDLESKERKLHEIDKSKTLDENIQSVCDIFEKPVQTSAYGLKLMSTNDGKFIDYYLSEENFREIKDGYFLKLVYSVKHYVNKIFDNINSIPEAYKEFLFEQLHALSIEPEFIKELARTEKHLILIDYFINSATEDKETTACLIAIVHLFQKNFITEISSDFLEKILKIIKSEARAEQSKYALSVIHKLLVHRDEKFFKWREEIIRELPIKQLTPFFWSEEFPDLQYGALLVINSLIKSCKGDKRHQLIKEMSLKTNRELIYKHIIIPNKIEKPMAHELYVLQTYMLSIFTELLDSTISLDSEECRPDEFEIQTEEVRRLTFIMDFDDTNITKNKNASIENLLDCDPVRISLASMRSEESQTSKSREYSQSISESGYCENNKISILTLEALRHYKDYHYKNFSQSQIEEKVYQPGIFVTSERIMQMLAKLLHIGQEPDKTSTFYQPIVFYCSTKTPFLLELFSRTMWLLSKTRREMKASTLEDYEKVIRVLKRQVKMVLEERPMDFKILTQKMLNITYETVMKQWQKEKNEEMNIILDTNPSVQTLRAHYREQNKDEVYKQRLSFVMKGTLFPKILENKKLSGNFIAKISSNNRDLVIYDYDRISGVTGEMKLYPLSNITHIIEGRACPHVINNTVKEMYKAFSVIIDNSEYINFIGPDKKTTSYWVDALNLLLGKNHVSDYYKDELEELVKMDLILHLIELQNVPIPKKAPPVPPNPFSTPPPIPPKPSLN